jgi:hypothetical protein
VDTATLLALGFALVVLFVVLASGFFRRRTLRVRSARSYEGEREAAAILKAHGFDIVGAQVEVEYPVEIDGERIAMGLRADYLVAKDGERFIAEVKTGTRAPRIETAATRRQLLEYELAFEVDGVLLVDADAGRIHTVAFPTLAKR